MCQPGRSRRYASARPGAIPAAALRHALNRGAQAGHLSTELVTFFRFDEADADPDIWARLNSERFKVRVKACYCSVLGDCWMYDSTVRDAEALPGCPAISEESRWHG